jgi:hypothetical protein
MRFISQAQIETRAAELWQRHVLTPGFDVERLLDDLDLGLLWEPIDDADGGQILGQLRPRERLVVLNERHQDRLDVKGRRLLRYTVGHEIGHWILHARAALVASLFPGDRTWCRDGATNPIERQAEMFSAALLMPRDLLKSALPPTPWSGWPPVYELADRFSVNVTPMKIRLEGFGWMHRAEDGIPRSGPKPDPFQSSLFAL